MSWSGEFKTKEDVFYTITDNKSSSVSFTGRTRKQNALTSDDVWEISRTSTVGKITKTIYASDSTGSDANVGKFNQVWDDRESLFPALEFSTTKSFQFNGTDEYCTLGADSSLDITNNLSAFCWVKGPPQTLKIFMGKWDGLSNKRAWLFGTGNLSNNKSRVAMTGDGSTIFKDFESSVVVMDGTWHFVGFTFASGTLKLFIDGSEDGSPTKTTDNAGAAIHSNAAVNSLGCVFNAAGTPANFLTGNMTEWSIWNDTVLTPTEILDFYNSGTPIDLRTDTVDYTSSVDLVSFWRPEESVFSDVNDVQGTNDGSMVNMEADDIQTDAP